MPPSLEVVTPEVVASAERWGPTLRGSISVPRLWRTVNGSVHLSIHAGQMQAWTSTSRYTYILAGTQSGKCLALGSRVLLADGTLKAIEDVQPGDVVLSLNETKLRIEPNTVSASFSTGVQPVFRFTLASGRSLDVTSVHPLYSPQGWQPSAKFGVGDRIGVPRGYGDLGREEADEKEVKLVGYLMGDGGLTQGSAIFTNADPVIVEDFRQCLPEGYEMVPTKSRPYDYRICRRGGQRTASEVFALCKRWGIWDKLAKEKRMPEQAFRLSLRSLSPMLAALMDCDGTVSTNTGKGVEIVLASEGLIDDLQHLFLRYGILSRKRYKRAALNGKVFHSWRLAVNDLDSLEIYRRRIGFVGEKQKRLDDLLVAKREKARINGKDSIPNFPLGSCRAMMGERGYKKPWRDQAGYELLRICRENPVARGWAQMLSSHFGIGEAEAHSDIYWDAVEKIEPLGEQPVWDITVENGHNFIANDIFAHNTTYLPWIGARNILQTCDPAGGNNDFLAVTATFDLFRLKFLPAMREVLEDALGIGRYWPSNKVIELRDPATGEFWAKRMDDPMWGRVILRAASSPGGLESATARGAILDEFGQDTFTAEAMEALDRRLSLIGGWIVGGTTPYTAFGWIRERVVIPARRVGTPTEQPGDKDVCLVQFDSCTNPAFSPEEFERARRSMPAWRFDLFYRGKLSRPAGQIFSCFRDRDVRDGGHRCKPVALPSHWLSVAGLDFGTTNTAATIGAVEEDREGYPTGRIMVASTYVGSGRHASEHAERISASASGPIAYAVGGAPSEDGWRQGYLWAGMPVHQPTERDVEVRIDRTFGTIKTGKLVVFETLRGGAGGKGLIDQVLDYSRELDTLGNPTDKIKDKAKYHLVDSLGYLSIGMGALTGMARRFLPFDPRKHWTNLPMKEPAVKPESWWPRFGGLVWHPNGAAVFLLGCTDPTGALHIEGEVIRSGVSEGDMSEAIKALILAKRGDGPPVPIVGNPELFADLPTQGGGLVGESAALAFMRAGLSLTSADGDGVSEWSELRDRLEARGARSLTVDRKACPSTALTLMLIEPDALEPGKPAKHSPIEPGLALCYLLLLRPEPAQKSAGAKLIADLNLSMQEAKAPGFETINPDTVNPELLKLLTKKK